MKTSGGMERIWMLSVELEKRVGCFARPMCNFVIMREAEYSEKTFGVGIYSVVMTYIAFHIKKGE